MQLNGIAHIQLTVSNFKRSLPFYKKLLAFFDMTLMYENDHFYYCIGGKTGIAISQADDCYQDDKFIQRRVGLHHFCVRVRERDDIDKLYEFVKSLDATIIRAPAEQNEWAPGMYSVLFADPDGIRIEANFVPGKGNLDANVQLPKRWEEQGF